MQGGISGFNGYSSFCIVLFFIFIFIFTFNVRFRAIFLTRIFNFEAQNPLEYIGIYR